MKELQIFRIVLSKRFKKSLAFISKRQDRFGYNRYVFTLCITITPIIMCSCSTFSARFQSKTAFEEANNFFISGNYEAFLNIYEQIIGKFPTAEDRSLFEMGIIYAHPKNEKKDFKKVLECFERITKDYPGSGYKQDSEMMIFYINNVTIKDHLITTQQTQIETLLEEVRSKENEISALQDEAWRSRLWMIKM